MGYARACTIQVAGLISFDKVSMCRRLTAAVVLTGLVGRHAGYIDQPVYALCQGAEVEGCALAKENPGIKEKPRHYAGASCVFYSTPTLMRTLCNAYICAAYHVRINKCLQQPNHSGNDRAVGTSRIVQCCLNRATHCEHLALESQHPDMQFIYRDLAQQWRDIARQVEQLENDQSERPKSN